MTWRTAPPHSASRTEVPILPPALLVVLACTLFACRTESSARHEAPPGASAAAATPPTSHAPSVSAPSALTTPTTAPASSSPRRVVETWLEGTWHGSASVYADVVDDHQTYDRREVQLSVTEDGQFEVTMQAGNTPGGRLRQVSRRCQAVGHLTQKERVVVLHVAVSSCSAAPTGTQAKARIVRVNECLAQWNTLEGTMPYEVGQIALRREGCR